ncbi:hypothetical protein REH65_31400 [Saccharopolyspora sp. ID03-671]|uniref:hypothetical protein n=1 Tax=Saccharopolyspora sp. ID03-671 TaxID=3073066 RepID=UPI003247C6D0
MAEMTNEFLAGVALLEEAARRLNAYADTVEAYDDERYSLIVDAANNIEGRADLLRRMEHQHSAEVVA